jgi:hypothetical protein
MSEILDNEGDLSTFLEAQEKLRAQKIEIVIPEKLLEDSPYISKKYGYSIIDGEDLPNGYIKLTLVYRG